MNSSNTFAVASEALLNYNHKYELGILYLNGYTLESNIPATEFLPLSADELNIDFGKGGSLYLQTTEHGINFDLYRLSVDFRIVRRDGIVLLDSNALDLFGSKESFVSVN